MLRTLRATAAAMLIASIAYAGGDAAGTTAANFLSVGSGAGVLSMGGATLGAGRDLQASAWNPASLAMLSSTQFSLAHASLASQASQEWLAAGGRFGNHPTRWGLTALVQNEGGFQGRDALDNPTSDFSVSNLAVGAQVAQPLGSIVSLGLGVNWVHESLADVSGSGLGFDAGLRGQSGPFGFGLAARNVGGKMNYGSASYDLPGVVGAGVSYAVPQAGLRFAVDANMPKAYWNDVRMGAEWMWKDRVALRTGYRMEVGAPSDEQLSGLAFGLGAGTGGLWFDYAFLAGGSDAQGAHRLSLTFHPGALHGSSPEPRAQTVMPSIAPKPAPRAAIATPVHNDDAPAPLRLSMPSNASASDAPRRTTDPQPQTLQPSHPVKASAVKLPKAESATDAPAPSSSKPAAVSPKSSNVAAPTPAAIAPTPAKPEPAKAEPAKVEPAKSEPAKVEPAKSEPAKTDAAKVEPVKSEPAKSEPAKVEPAKDAPRPASVTVKSGETLADIAKRWGTSSAAIMMENDLVSEQVKPGQKLKLPAPIRH